MNVLSWIPLLGLTAIAATTGNGADAVFVKAAMQSGQAEIAQAAVQANSTDYRVRQFAGRMTTDHGAADRQLVAIASTLDMDVSAAPQPGLSGVTPAPGGLAYAPASGKVLAPAAYFRQQVRAHADAISLFSREAASGSNARLRAFAARTLPVLKSHLALARKYLASY